MQAAGQLEMPAQKRALFFEHRQNVMVGQCHQRFLTI
jgi:hypothetical protein